MVLLDGLQQNLSLGEVVDKSKNANGDDTKKHLARVEERDQEEDDEGRDEVISLIVQKIAHYTIHPSIIIVDVRNLKPGLAEDEIIHRAERS